MEEIKAEIRHISTMMAEMLQANADTRRFVHQGMVYFQERQATALSYLERLDKIDPALLEDATYRSIADATIVHLIAAGLDHEEARITANIERLEEAITQAMKTVVNTSRG